MQFFFQNTPLLGLAIPSINCDHTLQYLCSHTFRDKGLPFTISLIRSSLGIMSGIKLECLSHAMVITHNTTSFSVITLREVTKTQIQLKLPLTTLAYPNYNILSFGPIYSYSSSSSGYWASEASPTLGCSIKISYG